MTPASTPSGGPMIGHLIHAIGKPPVSIFFYPFSFFSFPLARFFRRAPAFGLGAMSAKCGADQTGAYAFSFPCVFPLRAGVIDCSGSG